MLLQKKCEYYRTCCDCLVAAACQDGSAWNKRKKLQQGSHAVLEVMKKHWISKSVLKTLKKYWNGPNNALGIEKVWKFQMEKKFWSIWAEFYWKTRHFSIYAVLCNVQNWVSWLRISKHEVMVLNFINLVLKRYWKSMENAFLKCVGTLLQHFYQPVINMVWDLWNSYACMFSYLALLWWERTSGKGAMRTIVGGNLCCSLLNSKSPLMCIVGKQRKDHTPRSLNYCFFANEWVLFFAMPFLAQRLCANGPFEDCPVRMFVKQHALSSVNVCETRLIAKCKCFEAAEQTAPAVTCCWK